MRPVRLAIVTLALLLALDAAALAAPARAPRRTAPAAHATHATHRGADPSSAAARAPDGAAATAKPAGSPKAAAARRLDDVNIEGEIQVPQVLFVTAHDPRRPLDFQHRRYLPSALTLGKTTPLPKWVALPQDPPPTR